MGLAACASERYVGSLGGTMTYANLGYGFSLTLKQNELDQRWRAIDPQNPELEPPETRPLIMDAPIDLDGDGDPRMGETVRHLRPVLRLMSLTSTGAKIDIDVFIQGRPNATRPIDEILRLQVAELTRSASISAEVSRRIVRPKQVTRIVEIPGEHERLGRPEMRLALIDQPNFNAENGAVRRQVVRVLLEAPEITPELRADHERILDALTLHWHGGPTTPKDVW